MALTGFILAALSLATARYVRRLKLERDGFREAAIDANLQLAFERERQIRQVTEMRLSNTRTAWLAGGRDGPDWTYGQRASGN